MPVGEWSSGLPAGEWLRGQWTRLEWQDACDRPRSKLNPFTARQAWDRYFLAGSSHKLASFCSILSRLSTSLISRACAARPTERQAERPLAQSVMDLARASLEEEDTDAERTVSHWPRLIQGVSEMLDAAATLSEPEHSAASLSNATRTIAEVRTRLRSR